MSLYDEAVLIQKPSGYKAEKLYNVKPSPQVSEQSSVEFDGVDDCLITDGDSVAQPTTYSFWCKASDTGDNWGVFGHGGDSIGAFHFNYGGTQPLLYLGSSYFRYWVDTSAQDDDEWHHWVVYVDTNDITNSKLYCDGVLQTTSTTNSSTSSLNAYTEGLTIGADQESSGNYFNGSISDFAVFSSELSAADVKEIYNYGSPNDLLLESSYGTDISQSSTKSVEFDGVDDYLDCGDDSTLDITTAITCSVWVNCESVPSVSGFVICKDDDNVNQSFQLNVQSSVINWRIYDGGTAYTSAYSINIVDSNWHHLVGTYDGLNVKLYVDGVLQATQSHSGDIDAASGENVFIGKRGDGSRFFNGSIDNVGIYDKALTQAEITRQYNGGQPIDLSTDATSDSLVAYYKMGDGTLDDYPLIADQTDATLGSELVTNGDFSDGSTDWDLRTGWTIADAKASRSGASSNSSIRQYVEVEAYKTYKVSYERTYISGCGETNLFSDFITDDVNTTLGLYTDTTQETVTIVGYFTPTYSGTMTLRVYGIDDFTGSIDNVSVKEIGGNPAIMTNMSSSDITTDVALSVVNDLESYYQMGDGILDNYPLIADQTNATLGSEEMVNGDLTDGTTNWTVGTGGDATTATIVTGNGHPTNAIRLVSTGSSNRAFAYNTTDLYEDGKAYKFEFWYRSDSGVIDSGSGTSLNWKSAVGSLPINTGDAVKVSGYATADSNDNYFSWYASALVGGYLEISGLSVKEVQGNPAMMTNMSSADIVAWTPNIETDFDVARSSWTTRINASGYIEQVAANVPRLNYDSGDSCPYLLTEAASTNLITYPISFGNSYWTKSGSYIHSSTDYDGSAVSTEAMTSDDGIYNLITRATWTQVNDATTGNELCTKMVVDGSANDTHYGRDGDASGFVSDGVGYSITADVYIPSSNSLVDGIGFGWHDYESGIMPLISTTADGDTQISADTWTTITTGTIMADLSKAFDFSIMLINGTNRLLDGNSSDYACVKNVVITPLKPFEAPKEIPVANSEELVENGDFSNGSTGWTIEAPWSIGSGVASYDELSSNNIRRTDCPIVLGNTYRVEFEVLNCTGSAHLSIYDSSSGTLYLDNEHWENGSYVRYFTASLSSVGIAIWGNTAGDAFDLDNISVKEVTSYSGGGFEREAYKFVENTSNSTHTLRAPNIITSSGSAYTFSTYAKAGERNWVGIEIVGVGNTRAWFDIASGVLGTKQLNVTNSSITDMGNGWYRCSITLDATSSQASFAVFTSDSDNSNAYQGDGESGVYLAYAQLEESDYASSLMLPATEGSTTSRVADAVTNAGNQSLFSGVNSSGTLYAEIAANSDDLTTRRITLSDGTANNRIFLSFYGGSSNRIRMYLTVDNVNVADQYYDITDITQFSKFGIRWTLNDFSLWVDGTEVATDTSGSTFAADTLTKLNFDNGYGNNNFYGKTKAIAVFDYLSDDEMETLTT